MLTTWWSILHSREKVTAWWLQEPQTLIQEATWVQIRGMQALHTLWSLLATAPLNNGYKTPDSPMLGRSFEGIVFLFAWQSNEDILFYFT